MERAEHPLVVAPRSVVGVQLTAGWPAADGRYKAI